MPLEHQIRERLSRLSESQRRQLVDSRSLPDGRIEVAGQTLVDFCSNDYLGLAWHPLLRERANQWSQRFGSGARASRLLSGNLEGFSELESKIAAAKRTESALVLGSGFQANSSVLASLLKLKSADNDVLVFSDRLVHASIHFGLAATRQIRFRHNDLDHLQQLLKKHAGSGSNLLIVTESVFSMEGSCLDVAAVRALATEYQAMLYVDEAHATGVFGSNGFGWMSDHDSGSNEVVMGTFGKALGSYGSYVAGSQDLKEYLINFCPGLIYSTALPPSVLGAIDAAVDLVPTLQDRREHLHQLADQLRSGIANLGLQTPSASHIIPIVVGDEGAVLEICRLLRDRGFWVSAIRPPTVPAGTARLRVSLSAAHSQEQVERFLAELKTAMACVGHDTDE